MTQLSAAAIKLLARREHSAFELRQKLLARKRDDEAVTEDAVDALILELQQQGLQSDARYAETYVRQRSQRGYGPQRIDNELRERGVSASIRRECIDAMAEEWRGLMQAVREISVHLRSGAARTVSGMRSGALCLRKARVGAMPGLWRESLRLQEKCKSKDQIGGRERAHNPAHDGDNLLEPGRQADVSRRIH